VNIYVDLTHHFNRGGHRAILSSGQAVVIHRLAIMSKDGDWLVRENVQTLDFVLDVLDRHGARYRFGAPLDVLWMSGGWSSHFEFQHDALRVRTDFVTRPPRLTASDLEMLWEEQRDADLPVVDVRRLVELKKTNREKDYAVIGELARRLDDPSEQLLASRSARDLLALVAAHPAEALQLEETRPLLRAAADGRDALERALDAERRALIHANELRLRSYLDAAAAWTALWPDVSREIAGLPLRQAHAIVVRRANGILPVRPTGGAQ